MPEGNVNIESTVVRSSFGGSEAPKTSLPQQLPDKSHAPLIDAIGEGKGEEPRKGSSFLEKMGWKPKRVVEEESKKPIGPGRLPWKKEGASENLALSGSKVEKTDEEVSRQVQRMQEADQSALKPANEDAVARERLWMDVSTFSPRAEAHRKVEAVRRPQQATVDFNANSQERTQILISAGADNLAGLPAGSAEAVRVGELETEMRQVFQSAVTITDFSIDSRRNFDGQYIAELTRQVQSWRGGILNDAQADSLMNHIENAALVVAGQPTDGFDWEYKLPTVAEKVTYGIETGDKIKGSDFQKAQQTLERLRELDQEKPPRGIARQDWQQEIRARISTAEQTINRLVDEAEQDGVFAIAAHDPEMRRLYNDVQSTRFRIGDPRLPTPEEQAVQAAAQMPGVYRETFWDDPALQALKDKYEGATSYIMPRVARGLIADIRDDELIIPGSNLESRVLDQLRRQRERDRMRAKPEEMLSFSEWREKWDFTWAENENELRESVYVWIDKFIEHLPQENEIDKDPNKVSEDIQTWGRNAVSSLEVAASRLDIPQSIRRELRSVIETHVNTLGGVRLLEAGSVGFEAYTQLLEADAYGFVSHHNAKMVLNKKSFIISDGLCVNDGEIYRAGDKETKKPLAGDTEAYRDPKEAEIIEYAYSHEPYIKEAEFEKARLGETEIKTMVAQAGLTGKDAEAEVERLMEIRRLQERKSGIKFNERYGWDDPIEEMLLVDSRGLAGARQIAQTDPVAGAQEEARVYARTGAFRKIKARLDSEQHCVAPAFRGKTLDELSPDERQEEIRYKIRRKMGEAGNRLLRDEIDNMPTQQEQDRALWGWVKEYNDERIKRNKLTWFPTEWDLVRLSVDKPGKLRDRALEKEAKVVDHNGNPFMINGSQAVVNEAQAMIVEVKEEYKYSVNGTDLVFNYRGLTEGQIKARIFALPNLSDYQKAEMADDILFERERRRAETERAYGIVRPYHKFTGYEARAGGMVARMVGADGKVEMIDINTKRQEILKAKIDKEAAEIEGVVDWFSAGVRSSNGTLTAQQIEQAVEAQAARLNVDRKRIPIIINEREIKEKNGKRKEFSRKFVIFKPDDDDHFYDDKDHFTYTEAEVKLNAYARGLRANLARPVAMTPRQIEEAIVSERRLQRKYSVFAATHALREIGIANDIPVWDYFFYGDQQLIALAAPLCGYTDDDKGDLLPMLDAPRREIQAVDAYLLREYMDDGTGTGEQGKILVVDDRPGIARHEKEQFARARVVNRGADETLTGIFQYPWNVSTSGGVKAVNLGIRSLGTGVEDMLWEFWSKDFQDFQGVVSRRDESENRKQPILNVSQWKDPKLYAERLRKARDVRTAATGGSFSGHNTKGHLIEPMNGAWKFGNFFYKGSAKGAGPDAVVWSVDSPPDPEMGNDANKIKLLEKLENPKTTLKDLKTTALRENAGMAAGIMEFLTLYMDARKYVVTNRAGKAPKNWEYDNELIFKAWVDLLMERKPGHHSGRNWGGELLGDDYMGYAIEARSWLAIQYYDATLRTSSYHLLGDHYREELTHKAEKAKAKLEKKRAEVRAQVTSQPPADLTRMITGREAELRRQNASQANLDKELKRLENQYIEERVHKEFVGEWPAMFAPITRPELDEHFKKMFGRNP